jgi:GNAT superfamily N-acetyltransferase
MIRRITSSDTHRVVELMQQLWPKKRIDRKRMRRVIGKYIEEPDYEIHGFEENGVLLGIVTVSFRWAVFYEGKVATIEELIVDQAHQRKGVGTKLVRFAEEMIGRRKEVRGIELSSDFLRRETHRFWKKLGYPRMAFEFRKEVRYD